MGEEVPEVAAWVVRTEADADVGDVGEEAFADLAADLYDAEAEGVELETGGRGCEQPAAELIEQPGGGGVQEQTGGVGPETVIAEAVGCTRVLEGLDSVLHLAPVDVVVVEGPRIVGPGGHDEAVFGPARRLSALKRTRRGWGQEAA